MIIPDRNARKRRVGRVCRGFSVPLVTPGNAAKWDNTCPGRTRPFLYLFEILMWSRPGLDGAAEGGRGPGG